ncbi:hypothetical protein [Halomonas sp. SpR8]|nr:hypothetical protein [Halomonas sp. SpR8]MDQ7727758.1 hypothetical protein [Halomonas sp. SpR8]
MSTDVAEMTMETLQNAGAKRCHDTVGDGLIRSPMPCVKMT